MNRSDIFSAFNPNDNIAKELQVVDNSQDDYVKNGVHLFYDWFAKFSDLKRRGKKCLKIIRKVAESSPCIAQNYNVWLKNNCRMDGVLHDDIRFEPLLNGERADEECGDRMYFVLGVLKVKGKPKLYEVWIREEMGFKKETVFFDTLDEAVAFVVERVNYLNNKYKYFV